MKAAIVMPLPLFISQGGLELQALKTAEALASLGIKVTYADLWARDLDADIVHCFGSEYQLWELIARLKGNGHRIVVSAIFLATCLPSLYVAWRYIDPLLPVKTTFGMRRRVLQCADAVITLTRTEARELERFFGIRRERTHVIPNGVERRFFEAGPEEFERHYGLKNFVLSVASIERRKGQLKLIEALGRTDLPLVLIGKPRPDERGYYEMVREAVKKRKDIWLIPGLPYDSSLLTSAYAAAKVHALPSLTEAMPLAALEAAAAGANLVLSNVVALRETFGKSAWYCDPNSSESIRMAVLNAYQAPRQVLADNLQSTAKSWEWVAREVAKVYEAVLSR